MDKVLKVNAKSYEEQLKERYGNSGLDQCIEIIVPGTINVSTIIDTSEYAKETAVEMCKIFGGATIKYSDGLWLSNDIIMEPNKIVSSNCTKKDLDVNISKVFKICSELRHKLNQECIAFSINGVMYYEYD